MKLKFYLRGLGIGILVTAVIMGIASGRKRQMTDEEIKARARELGMTESTVLSNMASNSPQGGTAPSQAPENTDNNGQNPVESNSPETDEPPVSEPSVSEPPVSEPPVSEPPASEPPVSEPPVSEPPVSEPPENSPEISQQIPENSPKPSVPAESPSPEDLPEPSVPELPPSPENESEAEVGETIIITIRSGQSSVAVSKMLEEAGLVESASAYDKFLCENGYDKRLKSGTHVIPVDATEEEIAHIITSRG